MSQMLDMLLQSEIIKNVQEKEIKVKRLSTKEKPFVLSLKGMTYNQVAELSKLQEESNIHIVLTGVTDPDFKNQNLIDKYGVPTPAELLKKIFLPGEIEDIAREIEKLSGYRYNTVEELKKK